MNTLTWKQFKELVESNPNVKDDTPIWYIDIHYPTNNIDIHVDVDGELLISD
jgi:hypothetical protein